MKYFVVLMSLLCGCATTPTATPKNDPNMIEVQSWQKKNPETLLLSEANGVVFINGKGVYKLPPSHKHPNGNWSVYDKTLVELIKKRMGAAKSCEVIASPELAYVNMTKLAFSCGEAELRAASYGTGKSVIENGSLKRIERQYSFEPKFLKIVVGKKSHYRFPPNDNITSMVKLLIVATQSGYIITVGRNLPAIPIYPECTQKTLRCINHSLDSVVRQLAQIRKRYPSAHLNIALMTTAKTSADKITEVGQKLSHIERKNINLSMPSELSIEREHFTYAELDDIEMSYGLCTRSEIRKVVKMQRNNVRKCFEAHLANHGHIQGKWWTRWNIKPDGSTKRIRIKPEFKSQHHAPFETCFRQVLGQMKYKPGKRVCFVRYPFTFSSD